MNTATEMMIETAERFEQHQADAALLACPRDYLARIGVTAQMITAAEAREAGF